MHATVRYNIGGATYTLYQPGHNVTAEPEPMAIEEVNA